MPLAQLVRGGGPKSRAIWVRIPEGALIRLVIVVNVKAKIKQEPVAFWTILHLVLNSAQLLALPVPAWLHVVIVVVSGIASAAAARQQVTPIKQV